MKNLLFLTITAIFLSSCSDSKTQGCTDLYAINYNSSADYDNGSCTYEVDVVFALDGNAAAYLNQDPYATEVVYYISEDDIVYNPIGADTWNSTTGFPFAIPAINPPICYELGYTSFTYQWSGSNNAIFYYEAIPDDDEIGIYWSDNVFVNKSDQCIYIPLELSKKLKNSALGDKKEKNRKNKNAK